MITLFLPKRVLEILDDFIAKDLFPNRSEAIRAAIYEFITAQCEILRESMQREMIRNPFISKGIEHMKIKCPFCRKVHVTDENGAIFCNEPTTFLVREGGKKVEKDVKATIILKEVDTECSESKTKKTFPI